MGTVYAVAKPNLYGGDLLRGYFKMAPCLKRAVVTPLLPPLDEWVGEGKVFVERVAGEVWAVDGLRAVAPSSCSRLLRHCRGLVEDGGEEKYIVIV